MPVSDAIWDRARRGQLDTLVDVGSLGDPNVAALVALTGVVRPPTIASVSRPRARTEASLNAFIRLDLQELESAAAIEPQAARMLAVLQGTKLPELRRKRQAIDLAVESLSLMRTAPMKAVEHARHAALMARSDGYVFDEYFASLVLARARRYTGHPHLAARIVGTLNEVAMGPWCPWVAHEALMAGAPLSRSDIPLWPTTMQLRGVLASAQCGDRDRLAELATNLGGPPLLRAETGEIAMALEGHSGAANQVGKWLRGESREAPGSLVGFAVPDISDDAQRSSVVVRIARGQPSCRLLRIGLPLFGASDEALLDAAQARTYAAVFQLAFAADGLPRAELFQRVYGFEYRPAIHGGTLRTLLHRVRQSTQGAAEITGDDWLQLAPLREAFFPDPTSTLDLEGTVLHHLARVNQPVSARAIAKALSVSPRSVHRVLNELKESGACEVHKSGRYIEYRLEDTTFHRPTLTRLRVAAPELE